VILQCRWRDKSCFQPASQDAQLSYQSRFSHMVLPASRMPDFGINTSCIKSIKTSYETKLESNKCVRGMNEYRAAERETRGETGIEPRTVALKGQPAKKSRQAVAKCSRGSMSKGEPIPKKARRESELKLRCPR